MSGVVERQRKAREALDRIGEMFVEANFDIAELRAANAALERERDALRAMLLEIASDAPKRRNKWAHEARIRWSLIERARAALKGASHE